MITKQLFYKKPFYNKTTILTNLRDDFTQLHLEAGQGNMSRHKQGQTNISLPLPLPYLYLYLTINTIYFA